MLFIGGAGYRKSHICTCYNRTESEAAVATDHKSISYAFCGHSKVGHDLYKYGKESIIKRIRIDTKADETTKETKYKMKIRSKGLRKEIDDHVCHGYDHARIIQNTYKYSGREDRGY